MDNFGSKTAAKENCGELFDVNGGVIMCHRGGRTAAVAAV